MNSVPHLLHTYFACIPAPCFSFVSSLPQLGLGHLGPPPLCLRTIRLVAFAFALDLDLRLDLRRVCFLTILLRFLIKIEENEKR